MQFLQKCIYFHPFKLNLFLTFLSAFFLPFCYASHFGYIYLFLRCPKAGYEKPIGMLVGLNILKYDEKVKQIAS